MRLQYIIVIGCLLTLTACGSKDKKAETSESASVDSLSEQTEILDTLSSGDWFTARCELLCDEEHGKFLDGKKLDKYGQYNGYDFTQEARRDSTIITFDFIADCCMDFAGGARLRNDTLILEYQQPHDSLTYGCDCYCDYKMIYRINKKDRTWTALKAEYKRRY